jgi:hypothetical protein
MENPFKPIHRATQQEVFFVILLVLSLPAAGQIETGRHLKH